VDKAAEISQNARASSITRVSVIHNMTAAPRDPGLPERKQFIAFLADLIESHVIGFPAYLLSGDVPSVYTIGTAMIPYQRSDGPEPASLKGNGFDLTVRYSGSDPGALLAAARLAPLVRQPPIAS
jgi:hypothetical protein